MMWRDTRTNKFSEWFDPENPEHIALYVAYRRGEDIDRKSLPVGTYFDTGWVHKIEEKMLKAHAKRVLGK